MDWTFIILKRKLEGVDPKRQQTNIIDPMMRPRRRVDDIRDLPLPPDRVPSPQVKVLDITRPQMKKDNTIKTTPAPAQSAGTLPVIQTDDSKPTTNDHSSDRRNAGHQQSQLDSTTKRYNKTPSTPLVKAGVEKPDLMGRNTTTSLWLRDLISLIGFILIVIIGAWLINTFVFRSFDVVGPSMEPTLEGEGSSDRLIVNRLPVTAAHLSGKQYVPERGNIIVFKNPNHDGLSSADEYIVKRVIGLPGERVTVNNCELKVYNDEHPNGFNPYKTFTTLSDDDAKVNNCVDGDGTDVTVPAGEIFVTGDHRVGNYSMDSRNGDGRATLGTIPLEDIVGPVAIRIWPLNKLQMF